LFLYVLPKNAKIFLRKKQGGAKVLFIDPENTSVKNKKCIICNKPAVYWVYVGRTY